MRSHRMHLLIQAGNGGNGCESYVPRTDKKIVSNGGDGGRGGSVIFRADTNAPPISNLRYKQHLVAESGGNGGSNRKRGRNGQDLVMPVPCGTRIYDRSKHLMIRDLKRAGEEVIVCQGGRGGSGNFGGKNATQGEKGVAMDIELEIQIMADVFLVGLPNSGKSRILNAMTRAHAKEETYPFTTTEPQVGVWAASDYEQITLCELPSIYQASHEGRGMGTEFLRHLERAKLILFILDPVSQFAPSLQEGLVILREELKIFNESFLSTPYAVLVNKMDLPEAQAKAKQEKFQPGVPVFYLSALTREGLDSLEAYLATAEPLEKAG